MAFGLSGEEDRSRFALLSLLHFLFLRAVAGFVKLFFLSFPGWWEVTSLLLGWITSTVFLAVQDSSIGDIVSPSVINSDF